MDQSRHLCFKGFTSFLLSVFLFTNIAYTQGTTSTLSTPNNIFEVSGSESSFSDTQQGEKMPEEVGIFKNNVIEDMEKIAFSVFFIEKIRPWEISMDPEKSAEEMKKRIVEAMKALRHLSEDPKAQKLLKIILDTNNIERIGTKGEGLEIPLDDVKLRIFRTEDIQMFLEGYKKIGQYSYRIVKEQTKDLKGKDAPRTNPLIGKMITQGKILEVFLDANEDALIARRVRQIIGYVPGRTGGEEYLAGQIKIDRLFTEEQQKNIKKWINEHKIREKPIKFRIALGNAALGWKNEEERSNISHAGIRDGVIYMGHILLKQLMNNDREELRKNILDQDEYRHLRGLDHGTEEQKKQRLSAVSALISGWEEDADALKNQNISAIRQKLETLLKDTSEQDITDLLETLMVWESVSLSQYKFPVESLYPVKKAIVLLPEKEQNKLEKILTETLLAGRYKDLKIIDEIKLLLDGERDYKNWIENNAAGLEGRTIWQVSPEIWHEAGGLARVMQYHGVGIKDLIRDSNVKLRMVEPHYQFRVDTEGEAQKLDYETKITHPFLNLEVIDTYIITVGGKEVKVEVSKGTNDLGVESYLIRDVQADGGSFYTHSLYNYRQPWESSASLPTWEEFSVFYSKAAFEFIQREEARALEQKKKESLNSEEPIQWKAPIIHTNDSQTALVGIYAFIKREEERTKKAKDPKFELDPVLEELVIAFTTHTYNNRTDYPLAESVGDNVLNFMEIPQKYREFFKHYKDGGKYFYSMASGGLRTADWQGTVGRTHMEDVSIYDEWITGVDNEKIQDFYRRYGAEVDMIAVSNGDNIAKTAEIFRNIGKALSETMESFGYFDPRRPTPEQIIEIKKVAKEQLTLEYGLELNKDYYSSNPFAENKLLDPSQPVISYSGRLVPEKAGRKRAFTDENIEKLLERGYQVVIYGNVQTKNHQSKELKEELVALVDRLKNNNYPGRLIFVPRFSLLDQRALLAATDIQVQDSDVHKTGWQHKQLMGTEAAGYTEANISACGGLQLAPPRPGNGEGLLKAQGIPINLKKPGEGNTLIPKVKDPMDPATWTSQAYLDILLTTLEKNPMELARYQATSVKLSGILDAHLTAAEYLRQFDKAVRRKIQKEKRREEYMSAKKKEKERLQLINQVSVPDPVEEPLKYAVYQISESILNRNVQDAVRIFFSDSAITGPDEYIRTAIGVSNTFLNVYENDGSTGELFRGFVKKLNEAMFQFFADTDEYNEAARDIQLITGQALTIMSWADRHVPGAENIRLTADEKEMVTSKKGSSFINKNTLPSGVLEVKGEGEKGFFWRGIEGVAKIGDNIIQKIINKKSDFYDRYQFLKDKMVLYLMDHGFIEVPEGLKDATDAKRITTLHETFFLNDRLSLSNQATSTGPGHFQGNGLDIKYVTEGSGLQVNVLYNASNEIVDVVIHWIKEGDWTLALPGYVDYMINTGGLRFNDISIALTDEEAQKFNTNWTELKNATIKPSIAPVMLISSEKEGEISRNKLIRNDNTPNVPISTLKGGSFGSVAGQMFSLLDVYRYKLSEGEKKIDEMVQLFVRAKEKAFARKEPTTICTIDQQTHMVKEDQFVSFNRTKGFEAMIEDNEAFLNVLSERENKTQKLLRIAVETLEQDGNAQIKRLIKELSDAGMFSFQLFSAEEPLLEVTPETYEKYGLHQVDVTSFSHIDKTNTITILPVRKTEEFTASEANKCWTKLGNLMPGRECSLKDTVIMPVGYNYDQAGLVRSIFLGIRLCDIARQGYEESHPFVSDTYNQYKEFCLSQGVDADSFTLTREDLYNMAVDVSIKAFTDSLNNLIRSLPIVPFNVEELRKIHERARETLIRA